MHYNKNMEATNDTEQKPYTATSLAQAAGVGFGYIARLCRVGKIPADKFGNVWMIRFEDGQRWLAERQAKLAAESPEV